MFPFSSLITLTLLVVAVVVVVVVVVALVVVVVVRSSASLLKFTCASSPPPGSLRAHRQPVRRSAQQVHVSVWWNLRGQSQLPSFIHSSGNK